MKLSDIMLDLGTGDASKYDAYVQEAVGQVKVSAAIYDAASQIASLNDYDREDIVQECATAGLPSDKVGATNLTYDCVARELIGTVRNLYAEAAIFVEQGTSPVSAEKGMRAIGKKFGVKSPGKEITPQYIADLADAIFDDKEALASNTKVVKASAAKNATENYLNAIIILCNMLGIAAERWTSDPVSKMVMSEPLHGKSDHENGVADLNSVLSFVKRASDMLDKANVKSSDYTKKPTKDDVATHLACMYAVIRCSDKLKLELGESGGEIEKKITKMIDKFKKAGTYKKAAKELNTNDDFNEKPIVKVNTLLCKQTKGLVSAFNNTSFAIIATATQD